MERTFCFQSSDCWVRYVRVRANTNHYQQWQMFMQRIQTFVYKLSAAFRLASNLFSFSQFFLWFDLGLTKNFLIRKQEKRKSEISNNLKASSRHKSSETAFQVLFKRHENSLNWSRMRWAERFRIMRLDFSQLLRQFRLELPEIEFLSVKSVINDLIGSPFNENQPIDQLNVMRKAS